MARSSDYNAWHAGSALAQDRVDCLGDLLGADLLEAVGRAECSVLLRPWESLITLALWSESALLFSWQAVSLIVFQSLFTIDLASAWLSDHHWIGGTEFMFDPHLPLLVRVLSLFPMVTPVILVWAVWRLGYDARAWKVATSACWVLLPIHYFWRPEHNVNWARGIFFRQQRAVPGWIYLMAYLVLVPAVVYDPTHLGLMWWTRGHNPITDRKRVAVAAGAES